MVNHATDKELSCTMEFPRSVAGKVVCLLMPDAPAEAAELKPIREWSSKAKFAGVTFRTTITGIR